MNSAPLGMLMGRAARAMRQFLDTQVKPYGITPMQYRAIITLYNARDQEFSQRDLEEALMLRGSTVNGILDRLEEKGMIIRRPSSTDGRRKNLCLTERGEEVHRQFESGVQVAETSMMEGFSPEEIVQFKTYLVRIINNLENIGGK